MEQQALVGRQSATAKVGDEVREKSSVSEVPRKKRTKDTWTKEEHTKLAREKRLWKENSCVREAGGNERSEGTATYVTRGDR